MSLRNLIAACCALLVVVPAARGQDAVLIQGARVFDGSAVTERADVLVHDGRVAAIAPRLEAPDGAELVEAAGMTLLPGLVDAHTHVFGDALRQALVFGVTTELDMFMDPQLMDSLQAEQRAGTADGRADVFSAGVLATAPGGHGTQFGVNIPTITSADAAHSFVEERLEEGSSWIKIVYDDGHHFGLDWPSIDRETLSALIDAAHEHERAALVHVSTAADAAVAIEEGADGLVHLFTDSVASDRFVDDVRRSGAFVIPTLLVEHSIAGESAAAGLLEDEAFLPYLDPMSRQLLAAAFPFGGADDRHYVVAAQMTGRLHQAGVPVLAGTDAPNPGTAHGAGLHRELELLVEAGLTPIEALTAATSLPARVFGLSDRGRLAPGMRADLLLVRGDPTTNIRATRAIEAVWKAGRRVDRETHRSAVEAALAQADGPLPRIEPGLVADFAAGTAEARFGTDFTATSDRYVGGRSHAELAVEAGDHGTSALRVSGRITEDIDEPWAGAMWGPLSPSMGPADLSAAKGIAFRTRGDGGTYRIQLYSRARDYRPVEATFHAAPQWSDVVVEWEDFGIDVSDVSAVLFTAGPDAGAFSFLIDDVRLE